MLRAVVNEGARNRRQLDSLDQIGEREEVPSSDSSRVKSIKERKS